jgi:hypothetical protein
MVSSSSSYNDYSELYYEQPMFLNTSKISITSITYNPSHHHSEWIPRLFGDEAIFHNRSYDAKSPKPLTPEEKKDRTRLFQEYYRIPPEFLTPTCSIEMLGFAVVNEQAPLAFSSTKTAPSMGTADLTFFLQENDILNDNKLTSKEQPEKWQCIYRAMYDNVGVLNKLKLRPNHYWPIFIYCPAPNHDASCLNLVNMYRTNFKKLLIDDLRQQTAAVKEEGESAVPPNKVGSDGGTSRNMKEEEGFIELPNDTAPERTLKQRRKLQRNGRLRGRGAGSGRNVDGSIDLELYKRLIRTINSITNINMMGLRSFHQIPSFAISRKFLIDTYRTILGVDDLILPNRPKFQSEQDHYFIHDDNAFDYPYKARRKISKKSSTFTSIKRKGILPTIHISSTLTFRLTSGIEWNLPFEIDLINSARKPRNEELGVCSIIPYVSSDDIKAEINGAMIYDYIRYYSQLGYKIMLFDRNGRHFNAIFSSKYAKRFDSSSASTSSSPGNSQFTLHYYNYTILQALNGYPIDVRYENDIGLSPAVVYTDYDKRYTYTYCRFALKHLYGIENVVINDFDEFLYCPEGGSSLEKQRFFQKSYFQHLKKKGIEQLFMKQRVLISKEDDMKECLYKQLAYTKDPSSSQYMNASMFNCISSFQYSVRSFFDKTLHFGHYCPYTHYHYASYLRYFDCYADTYLTATRKKRNYDVAGCSMIHLTTRPATYNRSHPFSMSDIQASKNEMISIING